MIFLTMKKGQDRSLTLLESAWRFMPNEKYRWRASQACVAACCPDETDECSHVPTSATSWRRLALPSPSSSFASARTAVAAQPRFVVVPAP
ncbi:MAG: hypothetical protein HYV45_01120 [Candidatus Moranbacteria bacterium]|nr:hypothetical protein [Candidatus Moranbacteria bacterium]